MKFIRRPITLFGYRLALQNMKSWFTKIAEQGVSGGDITREIFCVNQKNRFFEVIGVCQKMQQDSFLNGFINQ